MTLALYTPFIATDYSRSFIFVLWLYDFYVRRITFWP